MGTNELLYVLRIMHELRFLRLGSSMAMLCFLFYALGISMAMVAQCSLAFEVLQSGFEDVLELTFQRFWSPLNPKTSLPIDPHSHAQLSPLPASTPQACIAQLTSYLLVILLRTRVRDCRTSSVFCAWVAPWEGFVSLSVYAYGLRMGCEHDKSHIKAKANTLKHMKPQQNTNPRFK